MVYFKYDKSGVRFLLALLISFGALLSASAQTLELAKIFTNHMVIQRDVPVPIWGTSIPDEKLTLFFNGVDYETKADSQGHWEVQLPAQPAGGPFEISIVNAKETIRLTDILVGDVWLCSGQSNMEWTVDNSNNSEEEIRNGNHPKLRHFKVPRSAAPVPESKLAGGEWLPATSKTVGSFTAVGYFFARHIEENEKIPIGLLNSSWGGSRIEPWIRSEDLGMGNPEEMAAKLKVEREEAQAAFIESLKQRLATIPTEDLGMQGDKALWAENKFNVSDWETMELPKLWEQAGWDKTDGVFWFRRTFNLGKGLEAKDAILHLGPIDDSDQTWVNGRLVGSTEQAYNKNRVYTIPSKYLVHGENSITVRVDDTGGGGGIYGDPELMFVEAGQQKIPLEGIWKYKIGMIRMNQLNQGDNQKPTLLYNKMIHPILRFPIKGVLWYQGESNAGNPEDARAYTKHFKALITSWRRLWGLGDFPFLYVQLANFMAVKDTPASSNWALLREAQSNALELPHTGQAVIIDIGEANDIHPRNKQDVGKRLALAAQKVAYGKDLVYSGPTFKSMKKEGNKIVITMDDVGGGLKSKDGGPLKGFAIADGSKKFVWAKANIVDNTIVVLGEGIDDPEAVRYAWADNPVTANLYNAEGLPASPFRTDDWEN